VGTRFSIVLQMQQENRAGQLASCPARFSCCICSTMEKRVPTRTIGRGFENASGLGSWTNHPMHLAHMVDHQSHVRTEPSEVRARRARAQNRHETTDSQMVFVGTVFPPYYKCSWEIEQDNWPGCRREIEPDNWSVVRTTGQLNHWSWVQDA